MTGEAPISLSATVNNFANPEFFQDSGDGTFFGSCDAFTLDFGNLVQGDTESAILGVINDVLGLADLLDGLFEETVTLMASGHNASGFDEALPDVTLTLRGRVVGVQGVPEPQTVALVSAGCNAAAVGSRRPSIHRLRRHSG